MSSRMDPNMSLFEPTVDKAGVMKEPPPTRSSISFLQIKHMRIDMSHQFTLHISLQFHQHDYPQTVNPKYPPTDD